jgi:pimeloyl-ACP methyl ester carboxylesterase
MDATYPGAVAPERNRTLTSLGLRLHVAEWGDPAAEPVLLLHGFYDHVHAFDLLAPLLAERFRVVCYDARGHGESEWPDSYSWQTDVLDAIHVLRDLGRPAHIVGHSRGGGLATDCAAQYPDPVRGLVVLDGFGPPPLSQPNAFQRHRLQGSVPQQLTTWLDWRRGVAARRTFAPASSLEELAARRQVQNPRLSLEWLRYFAAHGSRRVGEGFAWNFDPMASRGAGPFRPEWIAPGWRRLKAPMLAVVGDEPDTWGPLDESILSERLANVPVLTRATVRGAGHFMHIEKPRETAALIRDFLEAA